MFWNPHQYWISVVPLAWGIYSHMPGQASYFKTLAFPASDCRFDSSFYYHICNQYSSILEQAMDDITPLTVDEGNWLLETE